MGTDARWFTARDWRYVPTEEYGGPKVDERPLEIRGVTVSADRRTVNLHIPQIQDDRVLYLRVHPMLQSQTGRLPWATESWSTINRLPAIPVMKAATLPAEVPPGLSSEERQAGFRSLFDGRNLDAFKGWNRPSIPRGWSIKDGTLTFTPGTEGGDIATKDEFDNFELRLQWRISEGGNSGIMLRSVEGGTAPPYVTGVEMQVLDNGKHSDGANPFTSAGSAYALYAPPYDVTRPVGTWNDVRIVVSGTAYEFYLNGVQTAKFNVASEEWRSKIATSKFNGWNGFGASFRGRVVLQDHGDVVSYRNIRIRPLGASGR
jgi:cytochrome c